MKLLLCDMRSGEPIGLLPLSDAAAGALEYAAGSSQREYAITVRFATPMLGDFSPLTAMQMHDLRMNDVRVLVERIRWINGRLMFVAQTDIRQLHRAFQDHAFARHHPPNQVLDYSTERALLSDLARSVSDELCRQITPREMPRTDPRFMYNPYATPQV